MCKDAAEILNNTMTQDRIRPYQAVMMLNSPLEIFGNGNHPLNSIFSVQSSHSNSESCQELLLPNVSRMATSWPRVNTQLFNPLLAQSVPQIAKSGRWHISKTSILYNKLSNYDIRCEKKFSFAALNDGKSYEKSDIFKGSYFSSMKIFQKVESSKRIRKKGAGRKTANPQMEADLINWFNEYAKQQC
jgi:hypothetical protein